MTVAIDGKTCIGCGLCVDICPEVFEMGSENIAVVKVPAVPPAAQESCQEATENCPVEAISITG